MKKRKQFEKELNSSKRKKLMIRIKTRHPDGDCFDSVVLENQKDFVVLQDFHDFESGGIVFVPKKWISGFRNGEFEKNFNKILRFIGDRKYIHPNEKFKKFKSFKEIFEYLKAKDVWPIIEIVFKRSAVLYIGPITEVNDNSFKIYCYDANGKWEKNYKLNFRELFRMEIDSKYAKYFNKYMRAKGGRIRNAK